MFYYNSPKAVRLTIRTQNRLAPEPDTIKIWETFNKVAFYWFKDRKDGPSWTCQREKLYHENGKLVHRITLD